MTGAQVLDPRTEPAPAGWADFVAGQHLHPVWRYELIRLEAWLTRNPPVLAVARDGGRIVAAVYATVCRPWLAPRYATVPTDRTRRLGPRWVEVCVPWVSGFPGFAFDGAAGPELRRDALRAIEHEFAEYLGGGLLGVLYRPVGPELVPVLRGRGRLVHDIDSTAVLRNRWSTVEEWLASLGGGRRKSLRKAARRIESDPTLRVEFGPARAELDPYELATLLDRHRNRLGVSVLDRRTPMSGAYLREFVRQPDVHTLTYRDSRDRLLAFSTLMDHPDSPVLQLWAAVPVAAGGRANLYFDCYLRGVRHTIDNRRAELLAGRGLQTVKDTLGFSRRQLTSVGVPRPMLGRDATSRSAR